MAAPAATAAAAVASQQAAGGTLPPLQSQMVSQDSKVQRIVEMGFGEAAARQALRSIFSGFGPHSDAQWLHLTDTMLRDIDGSSRVRLHYDPAIAEPFRKAYPADAPPGSAPADITLWPIYDAIACPTLVLRGVESDLLSADILREMSQRGPRAQTREFAGIGHAPTLMSDEQIAIVRSFLEGAPLP